jgi:hypothetical protein
MADNEIPRRCYVERWVPAEQAISDAVQAVEVMGADVRLTEAVILLSEARDKVADYVDGTDGLKQYGYFLDQDCSTHWYVVPEARRVEWDAWCALDEDDEDAWEAPEYATRLNGSPTRVTFRSYRLE